METKDMKRAPLPTAPGSVIWAYAGGTHWALFARDAQVRETELHNWVSLDPSTTWVQDSDIMAWEPRFSPSPAESQPPRDIPAPEEGEVELPDAPGSVIWGYSLPTGWTLFARGDLHGDSTNWISLGETTRYLYPEFVTYAELRYTPSPAESRPQLGLTTYHLDEDGAPVATRFVHHPYDRN